MIRILVSLLLPLLLGAAAAEAQVATPNDCSGSVGATAALVSFPKSGATGPTVPSQYVTIQNVHATQNLCVNAVRGGTAACNTAGSFFLVPNASISWSKQSAPPPGRISVIGSGAATTYTCAYQ